MNLDMIEDPTVVSLQPPGWVWIGGGPYFHIPISNFIGWFFVTFFAIALFRCYEALKSESLEGARSIDVFVPVIYLAYLLGQVSRALQIGHPEFALIGFSSMFPCLNTGLNQELGAIVSKTPNMKPFCCICALPHMDL